jgi:hypothetical protein
MRKDNEMKKLLFGLIALFVIVTMTGGALACVPTPTPTPTNTATITGTSVPTVTATPINTPTATRVPYNPPKPVWLQLWISTEPVFNIGVTPGPDNGCFVYDLTGEIIPTSTAMKICSATPDASAQLVFSGWVTLPYPGTLQCWSSYKDASKCDHEGDILLAKINAEHGWHLSYAWFFPGYGGH